jgi:cyclic pyranopterin phosphate synthase
VEEMTPEEIERLVLIASSMGVRKVKLTGGEPLLRDDIVEIVSRIAPAVSEVSMTTNGSGLEELAGELRRAGLGRINVSLHTLDHDAYRRLCGLDIVDRVVRGVERAVDVGLNPVKVNMVVMKDLNEDDIPSMIEFCSRVGAVLQLIEYMSDRAGENGCAFSERFYSLGPVEKMLSDRAAEVTMNELHRRRRYRITDRGKDVTVEVVRPMHNTEFCSNCTRIRLSSDGKLKPCLLDASGTVDILTPLRSGADARALEQTFLKVVSGRRPYWS